MTVLFLLTWDTNLLLHCTVNTASSVGRPKLNRHGIATLQSDMQLLRQQLSQQQEMLLEQRSTNQALFHQQQQMLRWYSHILLGPMFVILCSVIVAASAVLLSFSMCF